MKNRSIVLVFCVVVLATAGLGDSRDGHKVTIRVIYSNKMEIRPVGLSDKFQIIEELGGVRVIKWQGSPVRKKITVSTDFGESSLYVVSEDKKYRNLRIDSINQDIIRTISGSSGNCEIVMDSKNNVQLKSKLHRRKLMYTFVDIE